MTAGQAERPIYYQGQFLGPEDLAAGVAYSRAQAARHALGGHTWGIAAGLRLREQPTPTGGGRVDVLVEPGYAWDGFGRGIVVAEPYPLPLDLFRPFTGDPTGPGRPIEVWIRYDERTTQSPRPGYESCEPGDHDARAVETFRIEAGPRPAHPDRHDPVDLADRRVDAEQALRLIDPNAPPLPDESVPHQALPGDGERVRWLIPLGVVRWLPSNDPNLPGALLASTPADLLETSRRRRYVGVVAAAVEAAGGTVRVHDRTAAPSAAVSDELLQVGGDLRVDGDARLFGGAVQWYDATGGNNGVPLTLSRVEDNGQGGSDLRAQLGQQGAGTHRLTVGHTAPAGFQDLVVVRDDGRVGIGAASPTNPLHVSGTLGIRQNSLYLSGGPGWSSIAYNAHHDPANTQWVIPDPARRSMTIELDDFNDITRLEVYGTLTPGGTDWRSRLRIVGQTGDISMAVNGGRVGVGTTSPTNLLHINGTLGVRQNSLYLSGGPGWSSIAYNAHHDPANTQWVIPDPARRSMTIELDDASALPRMEVYGTQTPGGSDWVSRLRVYGVSGDVAMAHSGGRVGVGTASPTNALHVSGNLGLRQNSLYLSGGPGGSSLSYNAHRDATNTTWVIPDPARRSMTVELDDFNDTPRFEVWGTQNPGAADWLQRLRVLGRNGDVVMAHNGGNVGIGAAAPGNRLHVSGQAPAPGAAGPGDPAVSTHVARIENLSNSAQADVLALRVAGTGIGTGIGTGNNFITFLRGNNLGAGAIEGNIAGGVTYRTTSADFAETLPRLRPEERLEAGDVVGVHAGRISRRTAGADHLAVITARPAVAGNLPDPEVADQYEDVALLGQVPVKVRGSVGAGDAIVPSGREDGTAVAVPRDEESLTWLGQLVATAWESSAEPGLKLVTAAVGLAPAQLATRVRALAAAQQEQITALRDLVEQVRTSTGRASGPAKEEL